MILQAPSGLERRDAIAQMVYSSMRPKRRVARAYPRLISDPDRLAQAQSYPNSQLESEDITVQALSMNYMAKQNPDSDSGEEGGYKGSWDMLLDVAEEFIRYLDAKVNASTMHLDTVMWENEFKNRTNPSTVGYQAPAVRR